MQNIYIINYIPIHTILNSQLKLKTIINLWLIFLTLSATQLLGQSAKAYPTYPGGEENLMRFLTSNIHYPKSAIEKGEEGRVRATFIIEYDGKVSNVLIWDGLSIPINEEAARVVRSMPRWNLGYKDGKRVRAQYTVWIDFKIPNNMASYRKAYTK